jgi:hypothetical protein
MYTYYGPPESADAVGYSTRGTGNTTAGKSTNTEITYSNGSSEGGSGGTTYYKQNYVFGGDWEISFGRSTTNVSSSKSYTNTNQTETQSFTASTHEDYLYKRNEYEFTSYTSYTNGEHSQKIAATTLTVKITDTNLASYYGETQYTSATSSQVQVGTTWLGSTDWSQVGRTSYTIAPDGWTTSTYFARLATVSDVVIYTSGPSPTVNVYDTTTGDSTTSARTDTLYMQDGYFVVSLVNYPTTTESFVMSTAYAGTNPATATSIAYSSATNTRTGFWGTTTVTRLATSEHTYTINSATGTTTTATVGSFNQAYWNTTDSTTATRITTRTQSTTTQYALSTVHTSGQTYYLYAQPFVTSALNHSFEKTIVADTVNGEFFWDCSQGTVGFLEGSTYTSKAYTTRPGYWTTLLTVERTQNITDTPIYSTVTTEAIGTGTLDITGLGTVTNTQPPHSVSVYDSVNNTTKWQTFHKNTALSTVTFVNGVGVETGTVTSFANAIGTITYTTSRDTTTTNNTIIWDGTAFTPTTYALLSSAQTTLTSYTTGLTAASLTNESFFNTVGLDVTDKTTRKTWNAQETQIGTKEPAPYSLGGGGGVYVTYMSAAGPRIQIQPNAGYSTDKEAVLLGDVSKWYPELAGLDGVTLKTPLIPGPLTRSRASAGTSWTYSWNNESTCIAGISASNATSTATFSTSFSEISLADRFLGTEAYAQALVNQFTTASQYFGNAQKWTGFRGLVAHATGPYLVTELEGGTATTTKTTMNDNIAETIDDKDTAYQKYWAGSKNTANTTYALQVTPPDDILALTHTTYQS